MTAPARLFPLALAVLLGASCSEAGPGAESGGDAAPLPTQGRAFVESDPDPNPVDPPTKPTAVAESTDADAAPRTSDTTPTAAERVEEIAYEATRDVLADDSRTTDEVLADPESLATDVAEEVVAELGGGAADASPTSEAAPEVTTTAPVASGSSDLEAGSVAPPTGGASGDDLTAGTSATHSGFQPLPRAFETDQVDPETGVPVLERDGDDILVMSFADLSYPDYIPRDPLASDAEDEAAHEFPERLTKFDGRRATIDGFMIPTSFRDGKVREFILSGDPPNCCFGGFPPIDRAIDVTLPEDHPGVDYSSYGVFRVIGELSIGETFDEYGYVLGIYQLEAQTVAEEF